MHVLLIEDNCRIREIVEHGLTSRGLVVSSAGDGISGIELARRLDVDLVLLDLVLPGMGGLDVLRQIRLVKPRLPVIALTGLDDTRSKVRALDAGADDYVTKPFSIEELAARIRALLRLKRPDDGVLEAGLLRLDLAAHRASLAGCEMSLSARELALLAAFIRHPGQVFSRQQLLEMIWGPRFDSPSNVVAVHIAALRRKMGTGLIETVAGLGYRFVVPEAGADSGTGARATHPQTVCAPHDDVSVRPGASFGGALESVRPGTRTPGGRSGHPFPPAPSSAIRQEARTEPLQSGNER